MDDAEGFSGGGFMVGVFRPAATYGDEAAASGVWFSLLRAAFMRVLRSALDVFH